MAGETEPIPASPAERRGVIRAPQNFVAGLALLAIAVIALGATTELGSGRFYAVGPGLLPRGVATLLGILGLGLVVTALSIGLFRYVLNLPIPILIIPGILVL
jgi:putative tricarboxylic transport membrane protein